MHGAPPCSYTLYDNYEMMIIATRVEIHWIRLNNCKCTQLNKLQEQKIDGACVIIMQEEEDTETIIETDYQKMRLINGPVLKPFVAIFLATT